LVVDDNDIEFKAEREGEGEAVCCSSSSSSSVCKSSPSSATAPTPEPQLRFCGDDGSIEVEVLCAAGKSKSAAADQPTEQATEVVVGTDSLSSPDTSSAESAVESPLEGNDAIISCQPELEPSTASSTRSIAVSDERHPNEN